MPDRLPRLLTSYYLLSRDRSGLIDQIAGCDLFIDSGAYSARNSGAEVRLDDYIAWLGRLPAELSCYANLDVIGDPDATWVNQQRMEAAGLTPLPVWHAGEPWPVLTRYLDRYPYIGVGFLTGGDQRMPLLVKAFRLARAAGAVFHGFGVKAWPLLTALPWYSVDSSQWMAARRWGAFRLFDPARGRWQVVRLRDARSVYAAAGVIRGYGVDPALLADRDVAEVDEAAWWTVSAASQVAAERWLRARHGPVVRSDGQGDGLRIYLAGVNPSEMALLPTLRQAVGCDA